MDDLIDRESLLKELYSDIHCKNTRFLNCVRFAPAVNRWIPCSERLPEYGEEVLVWFEYFRYGEYNRLYQTYGIGQFFGKDGKRESWLIDHETGWQKLKVYAWMPLPDPPESEVQNAN